MKLINISIHSSLCFENRSASHADQILQKLGKWYVVKHNCVTWGVFNDYIMNNYMFRPVLYSLSEENLRSYYKHARARGVEIST